MRLLALTTLALLLCFGALAQQPPQLFGTNYAYMQPTFNIGVSITASAAAQGDMASDGADITMLRLRATARLSTTCSTIAAT